MMRFYLMIGLPGIGKTTFIKDRLGIKKEIIVISPDNERFALFDYEKTGIDFVPERENEVWKIVFDKLIKATLTAKDIVFDATNLKVKRRNKILSKIAHTHYTIYYIYFQANLQLALKRNSERKRKVPVEIIIEKYHSLDFPNIDEERVDKLSIVDPITMEVVGDFLKK